MIKDRSRFGPCGCSHVPFNNLVWCWVMKPKRHLQEPDLTLVAPILLDSDKFCKLLPFFCSFWQYECCCHIMKYQCSIVLQKMHSLLDPLCFSSRCLKGSFQVLASQGQKNGVFKRIQGESDWDCKSFCFSILLFLLLLVESVTACCMFFSGVIAFWSFHIPMTVMTEVRMCPH